MVARTKELAGTEQEKGRTWLCVCGKKRWDGHQARDLLPSLVIIFKN